MPFLIFKATLTPTITPSSYPLCIDVFSTSADSTVSTLTFNVFTCIVLAVLTAFWDPGKFLLHLTYFQFFLTVQIHHLCNFLTQNAQTCQCLQKAFSIEFKPSTIYFWSIFSSLVLKYRPLLNLNKLKYNDFVCSPNMSCELSLLWYPFYLAKKSL